MHNRGQFIIGGFLVLLGLIFLLGAVFHFDAWAFCWPVGLILVGAWLVMRPRMLGPDRSAEVLLLGDLRRRGSWDVHNQEFWLGVGDVELDLTQAVVPPGETTLQFYSFVGDVDIYVPRSVGVMVRTTSVVNDLDVLGREFDSFVTPVELTSSNYTTAECRVRIEMTSFVTNLKVKHI